MALRNTTEPMLQLRICLDRIIANDKCVQVYIVYIDGYIVYHLQLCPTFLDDVNKTFYFCSGITHTTHTTHTLQRF